MQYIAADESLFTHINGEQIEVVGLIKAETIDIWLEIAQRRDSDSLKSKQLLEIYRSW